MKISRTQLRETVKAILSEMPMATGDSPLEGYLKDRLGADIAGILMDGVSRLMPEDQMRLQELAKQMVVNEQQCGNRNDSMVSNAEIELEQTIRMLVERGYDQKERKEKLAAMPKNKVAPKPRPKKPYGGGSKYRPYGRST